jgi:glycosyltransferase involved in cell wall biosynthesis
VRVLIFTQFFSPEVGATQTRLQIFAAGLAERGHDVTVICEVPNHPQGVIRPGYGRPVVRRRRDGFRVLHVWVKTSPTKTRLSRVAFYASYSAMAALVGLVQRRPDVVFASSPPLPVAAVAALVATRHRVPWVFDVRDLWPEAAVALGELPEGLVLDLVQKLADRLYESAEAITAVTAPFREVIAAKLSNPEKVTHLPNGTTNLWLEAAGMEVDRKDLGLAEDRFTWTFAGNVGVAQGLEAAIDAQAELADEGFHLLILGDGPAKARLQARAAVVKRGYVEFRAQVSANDARKYVRASDALLVPLAADPALEAFVPSKLFDFCAAGRPVVVTAAGESTRLARETGAALVVPAGDPVALASALRCLRTDTALAADLTERGKAFAADNLRDRQVERLARILEGVAGATS